MQIVWVVIPIHSALVERGALVLCPNSPCNRTIFPVRKQSGDYRVVQDLRIVNYAVDARAPLMPNTVYPRCLHVVVVFQ